MRSDLSTTTGRTGSRSVARTVRRLLTGVALAAIASVAVAACSNGNTPSASSSVNKANAGYGTLIAGSLPPAGTPAKGGTVTIGQLAGQTPVGIFPVIPATTCSTATFNLVNALYMPLYYGPKGARPEIDYSQSPAEAPIYQDNNKTVIINLKPGLKWSDGKPITSSDVIFDMDLIKAAVKASPANWCQYSPGVFPDNVASWNTAGPLTVVLHLKNSVNPDWFTYNDLQMTNAGIIPLPSKDWNIAAPGGPHLDYTNPANALKIFNYLNKQGSTLSSFASSPLWKVVDGPFQLKDFSTTNSSYDLVPNPSYGLSPKPSVDKISYVTYASSTAQLNALQAGSLEIGGLDPGSQLGAIPGLKSKGYSVYGSPNWGWYGGIINFKDTTNSFDKEVAQPYIRGVFAELVDQKAIISGVYHGWAVPAYGPVPTAPYSPFVSKKAASNPWPYDPAKAVATLKAHGWNVVPGGKTTCANPGTGSDQCGAGIPKGAPISFVWANVPKATAATGVLESEVFQSAAKKYAGIDVQLVSKTFNFLVSNYDNLAGLKYTNDWGVNNFGGIGMNYYPTQNGILSVGGALNMGSFSDPTAQKLMQASTTSGSNSAVQDEAQYFSKAFPVFWMPNPDQVIAVSPKVGAPSNFWLTVPYQEYPAQFVYTTK